MASRHLARSTVLQTLFECDVKNSLTLDALREVFLRNKNDAEHKDADTAFAESLLTGIMGKRFDIDAVIEKAAPQWPLDKIAAIDRNILRIGLFELLFGDHASTPPKVALNEAIELAKSYGGDSSGKFINGVLGAVYRDIGEPGKDDAPGTPAPLPHEHLGGVMLTARSGDMLKVALVKDIFGSWTLPKAKCGPSELSDHAALRALKDELGVTAPLSRTIGEHEYIAHDPALGNIVRTVGYYLAHQRSPSSLTKGNGNGITDVAWFSEDDVATLSVYPDLLPVLEAGFAAAREVE